MDNVFSMPLSLLCLGKQSASSSKDPFRERGMRKLGSGAYGTVYRLGQNAFKVIKCENENQLNNAKNEFEAMAEAGKQGDNVVAAESFRHVGDFCCIVMTACRGAVFDYLLRVWLKKLPGRAIKGDGFSVGPTETQILEIFEQMVSGVKACHSRRIVHCDIKPENFLFTKFPANSRSHIKPGTVKLADFGLAVCMGDREEVDIRGGTEIFAAPEVKIGRKGTLKSDIWSLGITLLTMLDNSPSDLPDILYALRRNWGFWAKVSPETKTLIKTMLQGDPGTRPSAEELHQLVLQHPLLKGKDSLVDVPTTRRGSRVAPLSD